jgi:hypothetical protein
MFVSKLPRWPSFPTSCICAVCDQDTVRGRCACIECPTCGYAGDLRCYGDGEGGHGLVYIGEQRMGCDETLAIP